jgi:hypothetical protein
MNMFRTIFTVIFFALALGLLLSDPTTWRWADPGGPYLINTLDFLGEFKPFSYLVLFAASVVLFLTRRQL